MTNHISDDQRLYLRTVLNSFRTTGEWPVLRDVQRELVRSTGRSLDVLDVAGSLPPGVYPYALHSHNPAMLNVRALALCEDAEEELSDFLVVVNLAVEKYFGNDPEPRILSKELEERFGMSELRVRKVYALLQIEPSLVGSGSRSDSPFSWEYQVSDSAHEFRDVSTVANYLETQDRLKRKYAPVAAIPFPTDREAEVEVEARQLEPRELQELIDLLATRATAELESFFLSHGLEKAFQEGSKSWGRRKRVNTALAAAAERGELDTVAQDASRRFRGTRGPSVFLSHSSKDKFFVRKLADRLQGHGVGTWLDEAELKIGDSLIEKIGSAIDDTDFLVAVLSQNSIQSEWVQRELRTALEKEFKTRNVVVLPLLLQKVELPPFLRDKVYADFTSPEKFDETFPKLLEALGVQPDEAEAATHEVESPSRPGAGQVSKSGTLSPSGQVLSEFEDIRIVGLATERSYKPDPKRALYNMYLELSGTPPAEWQSIFEAERVFPRHSMWRDAWVEGGYIVIRSPPDEIGKYHLHDLKQDVGNSNTRYRQYLADQAEVELRGVKKEMQERDDLEQLKRQLDFDS